MRRVKVLLAMIAFVAVSAATVSLIQACGSDAATGNNVTFTLKGAPR